MDISKILRLLLAACEPSAGLVVVVVSVVSCLLVVGRHSLVITVLRRKGAVIREERFWIFIAESSLVDTRSVNVYSLHF